MNSVSESSNEAREANGATEDSLCEFAKCQIKIARNLLQRNAESEADVTEKLIVPIIQRVYDNFVCFERASRAGRGSKIGKWDVEVYNHDPAEQQTSQMRLALIECKNMNKMFEAKMKDGEWFYKSKILNNQNKQGELFGSLVEYAGKHLDSFGDPILQVWIYGHSPNRTSTQDARKVVWSNGTTWVVFNGDFFNSGANPPDDIPFTSDGTISHSTKYFTIINFPALDISDSEDADDSSVVTEWCTRFQELRATLQDISGNS